MATREQVAELEAAVIAHDEAMCQAILSNRLLHWDDVHVAKTRLARARAACIDEPAETPDA